MGLIRLKGKWAVDYYRNGQRVREVVGESKTLAAQALAKVKSDLAQDKYFPDRPKGAELKVSEILDRYWTEHLQYTKSGPGYKYFYASAKNAFGHYTLVDLRKEEIERFMRATVGKKKKRGESTIKPATVNRIFQFLSSAINHGIRTDAIRGVKNPCALVRKLPENNVRDITIDRGQYESLIQALPDYLRPVVSFAYFTGCRKGEVLALKKKDIDLFQNVAHVRDSKNGEARFVPLHPELKETLIDLLKLHPQSEYLFNRPDGARLTDGSWGFTSACKQARLDTLHFHDLRHTALTNWHNEGHSHFLIMQASGHKTLSCFQRYLSFRNNDLQKLVLSKDGHLVDTQKAVEFAKAM